MNLSYDHFAHFRGKRFLFASGHFDYYSGAERQAVYFAKELVQNLDADVKFIGWGGNGRFADEIRAVGATPVVFPLSPGGVSFRDRWNWIKLAHFIRQQLKPHYILPYVWLHCRILGAIWKLTGAQFCWWNQRDEGRGIQGTRLERYLMRSLPAIVSNSWEGRDFLIKKFHLPPDRVTVINNGVELPDDYKDPTWKLNLGIPDSAHLIAMVANLTRFKDHATLLRAFAQTQKLCPNSELHLALIGKQEEATQELKALAWELNLGRSVHFVGGTQNVTEALRAVDIVVHSSLTEGCPNGALEAMALGLPVLGTNISGMRQAIGETATDSCLSPEGNWSDLAQKLAIRLNNKKLCEEEGTRNRRRIKQSFSLEQMSLSSLAVISGAMQKK